MSRQPVEPGGRVVKLAAVLVLALLVLAALGGGDDDGLTTEQRDGVAALRVTARNADTCSTLASARTSLQEDQYAYIGPYREVAQRVYADELRRRGWGDDGLTDDQRDQFTEELRVTLAGLPSCDVLRDRLRAPQAGTLSGITPELRSTVSDLIVEELRARGC